MVQPEIEKGSMMSASNKENSEKISSHSKFIEEKEKENSQSNQ